MVPPFNGRVWRKGCGKPGFGVCVGVHVIMCECVCMGV